MGKEQATISTGTHTPPKKSQTSGNFQLGATRILKTLLNYLKTQRCVGHALCKYFLGVGVKHLSILTLKRVPHQKLPEVWKTSDMRLSNYNKAGNHLLIRKKEFFFQVCLLPSQTLGNCQLSDEPVP